MKDFTPTNTQFENSTAPTPARLRLLLQGLATLALGSLLVTICYYYLDKPLAIWIHDNSQRNSALLNYFTLIPNVIAAAIPLIYMLFVVFYCFGIERYALRVLLAIANSVVITIFLKLLLKILFGRYWPETWINKNPSLIKNNAYGFHFFHMGNAYGSFPSGHTAVIAATVGILWFAYPKMRWLYPLFVGLVTVGLVGLNYHFLGDTIGGLFLGGLIAFFTVYISGIHR